MSFFNPPDVLFMVKTKENKVRTIDIGLRAHSAGVRLTTDTLPKKTWMIVIIAAVNPLEQGNEKRQDYIQPWGFKSKEQGNYTSWFGYLNSGDLPFGKRPIVKKINVSGDFESKQRLNKVSYEDEISFQMDDVLSKVGVR